VLILTEKIPMISTLSTIQFLVISFSKTFQRYGESFRRRFLYKYTTDNV